MNILNVVLSAIISAFFVFFSINNIIKEKVTIRKFLFFASIMIVLGGLSCTFFTGITRLISIITITTIALYFSICNKNFSDALYYAIVYEIFVFIVEILLSIIFVFAFKFNVESYDGFSLSLLLFSILNCLGVYLITKIKFMNKAILKFNKIIMKRQYELVYIIIVTILMILLITFNRYNLKDDLSFYINVVMIVFVFISLIYVVYRDLQNNRLEKNYNEMMEYVQKYEKIINEQGKKNHEYNNQLTVIKGYSKDPKKLEKYIDTIIEDHKCGQNYTIRQLSNFPDGGIKGLIYHKLGKMEDNKIKYYLYIDGESKKIFEKKFDLKTYQDITKLLGVFLDNAIDASKESSKKEIELDIKNDDNCIVITILNTFSDKVDIKQIGKKGFTTKGIGHGYGLSIVKDINKHNENIETFNDVEDDKFTQTILIYYK